MKRFQKNMLLLLLLCTLWKIFTFDVQADVLQEDFTYHVLNDGSAQLLRYIGTDKDVVVLGEINGYPVSSILDFMFYQNKDITSVRISSGITYVGAKLFSGCENLKYVYISDTVFFDLEGCMEGCTSLEYIEVDPDNPTYKSQDGVLLKKTEERIMLYPACKKGSYYQIPDGITSIASGAFAHNKNLVTVSIPESIQAISSGIFESCTNLEKIILPKSMSDINIGMFSGCTNLKTLVLSANITSIKEDAFKDCGIQTIYYQGNEAQWNNISIGSGNENLTNSTIVFDVAPSFRDVHPDEWFYEEVEAVNASGVMTGLEDKVFGPYDTLLRAQFASILYRMSGYPKMDYVPVFPDVPENEWYADAVMWAYSTGVITGYENGMFGPADMITREQIAIILYRYANYLNRDTSQKTDYSNFSDAFCVSSYAVDAMRWSIGSGIIHGKAEGTVIDPFGNATRAECAVIIQRFIVCNEK